jgi:hypothetical protein
MYYPSSQVKTNQYTNGGEYTLSQNQNQSPDTYTGFYYEVSDGSIYTGRSPDSSNPQRLYPVQPTQYAESYQHDNSNREIIIDMFADDSYRSLNDANLDTIRLIPKFNPNIPTQKDYNLGEFQRYFTKKNNENIYLEIDKETCDKLKNNDPKIAFDLYTAINLPWNLSGERDQTYLTNKNVVTLIEERNKWYGFTQWFKDDFLKYYKSQDIEEDLFTDGTEFINRRTKLAYRGSYHIHPEKGPMVGAKHIQREHDYLDPIQPTPDLIVDPTPIPTPTYSSGGGSTSGGGGGYSGGGGGY